MRTAFATQLKAHFRRVETVFQGTLSSPKNTANSRAWHSLAQLFFLAG